MCVCVPGSVAPAQTAVMARRAAPHHATLCHLLWLCRLPLPHGQPCDAFLAWQSDCSTLAPQVTDMNSCGGAGEEVRLWRLPRLQAGTIRAVVHHRARCTWWRGGTMIRCVYCQALARPASPLLTSVNGALHAKAGWCENPIGPYLRSEPRSSDSTNMLHAPLSTCMSIAMCAALSLQGREVQGAPHGAVPGGGTCQGRPRC